MLDWVGLPYALKQRGFNPYLGSLKNSNPSYISVWHKMTRPLKTTQHPFFPNFYWCLTAKQRLYILKD
jgi:hypothetical protein